MRRFLTDEMITEFQNPHKGKFGRIARCNGSRSYTNSTARSIVRCDAAE
jgi:hypothetical protein